MTISTNALKNTGSGASALGVKRDLGVVTDYFPICDNPNGVTGAGGYMGYKHEREKPQIRYTWYDRYLWKRYEEMRKAEYNATGENAYQIRHYARAFFDRYLNDRRYYYGSNTERE